MYLGSASLPDSLLIIRLNVFQNREMSRIGLSHASSPAKPSRRPKAQPIFGTYLNHSAELVRRFGVSVCNGKKPHLHDIFDEHEPPHSVSVSEAASILAP